MIRVNKKDKKLGMNPKVFLDRYGEQMAHMKIGNVIYVTYFGARTRIQRTGDGSFDYEIETWKEGNGNGKHR